VLFVVFGGGSLVFREYFSRRDKRLELAKSAEGTQPEPVPVPMQRAEPIDEPAAELAPATPNAEPSAEIHRL
jgi:hypothetical protein